MSLGASNPLPQAVALHRFSRARLVTSILRRQLAPRARRGVWLYDLLGLARAQALCPRVPYAVMLYGIEVWRPLAAGPRRALEQASLPIAISRATVEGSRPFTSRLADAKLLPLTLEGRDPQGSIDAAALERAGDGFALIVGRMDAGERYKGHEELLQALARPEASAVRLVVAGAGDDRERLERRAGETGVGERACFLGFVSENTLAALYDRCALLAMPSRGEGFGLVYLEAMRAGKPVLAARGGAAEEVVVDGETGRLVDPADPAALARALVELTSDPALAARYGAAGRRRFAEIFSAQRFEERLAEVVRELDRCAA